MEDFILSKVGDLDNDDVKNVRRWLRWEIDEDYELTIDEDQAEATVIVPGLRDTKVWDRKEFDWVDYVESHLDILLKECL